MKTRKITFRVNPTFFEIPKNDRFPNQKHDFGIITAVQAKNQGAWQAAATTELQQLPQRSL